MKFSPNYPRILADNTLVEFITDYLRLMVSGNMNAFEIEALMDEEIETYEQESEVPAGSLAMVGDSLPAFGIVAAVMGWYTPWLRPIGRPRNWARSSLTPWSAFPRYSVGLRLLAAGHVAAPEERRKRQDDAVHQGHASVEPERVRTADRGRVLA